MSNNDISRTRLFNTQNTDPTLNLAMEEALLLQGHEKPSLFLWQNAHTVVIGKGQNAWKECRGELLAQEGGTLVRRTTGGGAVYHDLGNLNFSFVMPKALYDVPRQLQVISQAVMHFGIKAEASGRNDIVLKDSQAKFSGNAFRHTSSHSLHHGTILMDVDMQKLGRYLQPSKAKLAAKGVSSVVSRVGNLKELAPQITIQSLQAALFAAFEVSYGKGQVQDIASSLDSQQVATFAQKYRSWDWTWGQSPRFDLQYETRFPFGSMEILLRLKDGHIREAHCFSDANDPDLAGRIQQALLGQPLNLSSMAAAIRQHQQAEDEAIAQWVAGLDL